MRERVYIIAASIHLHINNTIVEHDYVCLESVESERGTDGEWREIRLKPFKKRFLAILSALL